MGVFREAIYGVSFDNERKEGSIERREEIVRCRDCRWFTPEYEYQEEREYGVFETFIEPSDCGNPERCCKTYDSMSRKVVPVHIVTEPDGFCAWGEREDA